MARESSVSFSLFPAVLWNVTTPELVALPMLALAELVTTPLPAEAETSQEVASTLLSCICVLAADSSVDVST